MSGIVILVDLRHEFGPIRDQGPRPTCLAFAASDTHAGLRPGWTPLSCEYAFFHAQRRAGQSPGTGARLSSMLDALREDGQPEENGWPYLSTTPDPSAWVPPTSVGTLFGRDGEQAGATFDFVIHELNRNTPVIILLKLSSSFYRPSQNGVVHPAAGESPQPELRHAVVAVGHGMVGAHRAILVRNSWGENWGDGGYAWLTESFLAHRLFAAAKLMEETDVSADPAAA